MLALTWATPKIQTTFIFTHHLWLGDEPELGRLRLVVEQG